MSKYLMGLWVFAMGLAMSFAGKAAYAYMFYNRDDLRLNLVLATLVSMLAIIPIAVVVTGDRRNLDKLQDARRALRARGTGAIPAVEPVRLPVGTAVPRMPQTAEPRVPSPQT